VRHYAKRREDHVANLRCPKVWELNGRRERCVLDAHTEDQLCQVNVWLAIRCPAVELGTDASIEASVRVMRVE
jgi:hypothetical protein